ncbi:hypothetical protein [Mycobacteroides salmoniphilum]|uniref:hypothetical protein n=1 Tax=Mycobacteroides salmoniphilum TaxID=404941 RepID=UPI0010662907|nr:hypothetical protein [Mycobacteroides salmoniphilum]TDZ97973.1 hypothetical protein CCUG62472_01002 [Mycobacteroides salmoniphilum]
MISNKNLGSLTRPTGRALARLEELRSAERAASKTMELSSESPMTAEEFRASTAFLGLDSAWVAGQFGVRESSVTMWEIDAAPVPDHVASALRLAERSAQVIIDMWIEGFLRAPLEQRIIRTYRSDNELHRDHPEAAPLPASWHRAMCRHVSEKIPNLSIDVQ